MENFVIKSDVFRGLNCVLRGSAFNSHPGKTNITIHPFNRILSSRKNIMITNNTDIVMVHNIHKHNK